MYRAVIILVLIGATYARTTEYSLDLLELRTNSMQEVQREDTKTNGQTVVNDSTYLQNNNPAYQNRDVDTKQYTTPTESSIQTGVVSTRKPYQWLFENIVTKLTFVARSLITHRACIGFYFLFTFFPLILNLLCTHTSICPAFLADRIISPLTNVNKLAADCEKLNAVTSTIDRAVEKYSTMQGE